MQSTFKKLALASVMVGAAGMAVAPSAFAATPHLSPANTVVKGALKSGTTLELTAQVDGFALTVHCTTVTASGKTPANGLTAPLSAPPKIAGCTDSLGGTDTVKTSGTWKLTVNSTGSKVSLGATAKAATFSSSILSGCVITAGPTKAFALSGTYNNVNTGDLDSSFAISGAGCSTGATSTGVATIVVSPHVSVVG